MNRKILRLALPSIITNITVPLLGMVDTAIVGHLDVGSSKLDYIGGIAVGTMIFNFIYWNFGFLRLGTSGFTAQAYGARNLKESMNILTRALSIAIIISLILIILQYPIFLLTKLLIENNNGVWDLAMRYFSILIWAAPATLGMYALKGWFIGMQDAKSPMWISIFINVLNIVFSLIFVLYFGMKIEGVAWGTLIAQYGGLITTITIWLFKYSRLRKYINIKESLQWEEMKLFFKINSDIFLRTLCLVLVTTYFTIASSKFDYPTLAVNALLMQLFTIFSYFMDGFAYTAESLAGRYYGAKDRVNLKKVVKYLIGWGIGISVFFMIGYTFFGQNILRLLTNKEDIILASRDSFYWTLLIPLTGFLAFLYDGILIGLTASSIMRNVMFIASATFFIVYFSLSGILGNSALWLGFILYLSIRSFLSWYFSKKLIFSK